MHVCLVLNDTMSNDEFIHDIYKHEESYLDTQICQNKKIKTEENNLAKVTQLSETCSGAMPRLLWHNVIKAAQPQQKHGEKNCFI